VLTAFFTAVIRCHNAVVALPPNAHFCEACGVALTDDDVLVAAEDVSHALVKPRPVWFHEACWVHPFGHHWYREVDHGTAGG
jgi:hypothetical protein